MPAKKFIIVTTINRPTPAIKKIAEVRCDWDILVVADRKTPSDWHLPAATLLSTTDQLSFDSEYAQAAPWDHYARKNIGYLKAIRSGAQIIAETDDDNIPKENFLNCLNQKITGRLVLKSGWENIYRHFTDERIWPRGFPLEFINQSFQKRSSLSSPSVFDCPIQQYLVDGNPDVDAIYRLTSEVNTRFRSNTVVLSEGTFCPFNSQNTVWWPWAFPLLYLPSSAGFRMTDIWRSYVAQICLYKSGKNIAFCGPTMFQQRNEHSLIEDFKDEIAGYLNNARIIELLSALRLSEPPNQMGGNMRLCYERLVEADILPADELRLLDLWLKDIDRFIANHAEPAVKSFCP